MARKSVWVKKLNVEFKLIANMLKQTDPNLTLEDIKNNSDARHFFLNQTGIDLSKIEFKDYYNLLLNLDKVYAVGEIEDIPGVEGIQGYTVWFSKDAKDCWYLDPESFDSVVGSFL